MPLVSLLALAPLGGCSILDGLQGKTDANADAEPSRDTVDAPGSDASHDTREDVGDAGPEDVIPPDSAT